MRSRNIEFFARKILPLSRVYPFFSGVDMSRFCTPKLLEISMISGTTIRLVCMFAVAVSASAQGSSGEWSFDSLMGNLASRQSSHVAFREVKRLKVLDSSLTQRGTLIYTSPDTVIRMVEYPKKERFEIKGDQFTYEKDGKKKTVQLNARPAASCAPVGG